MQKNIQEPASKIWLGAGLLIAMTVAAYLPATQCGYIWDDDAYVTVNTLLSAPDGLSRIWFSKDSPSQYFPLVYTSFRIEYALWGLKPQGYHITNILLHAINALLLWRLLRFLSIPWPWLAAAIFALHPVQVESVAWITERKNVLMTFFFLLSLLAWLRFAERSENHQRAWPLYILSLLLYMLSLFSKTTACTLPAALVLSLWLKSIPISSKRWLQIAPYVLLGLAMGILTTWWEHVHLGVNKIDFGLNPIERPLIASRALWFYISKLVLPVNLTFSYPQWRINTTAPLQYCWVAACMTAGWGIWHWRDKLGRGPIAAIAFYTATLLPMLGFILLYTFVYTYVADHYQYVACIGPIALAVGAGFHITARVSGLGKSIAKIIAVAVLVTFGTLTWRQCHIYKNEETLWRDTIKKNPNSWIANNNFGKILHEQGRLNEALGYYRTALQEKPGYWQTHNNMGQLMLQMKQFEQAVWHFNRVLQAVPKDVILGENDKRLLRRLHYHMGLALSAEGKLDEAISHYRQALEIKPDYWQAQNNLGLALQSQGKLDEAVVHYRQALQVEPNSPLILNNAAWILATHPDANVRDVKQAIIFAERAAELTKYQDVDILDTLAAAYAAAGQFDRAAAAEQTALNLASAKQDEKQINHIRKQLELYKQAKP